MVVTEHQKEGDTSGDSREAKQQRTDSKARARRFYRRDRNRLRRTRLGRDGGRVDLRKHAPGGGLHSGGGGSCCGTAHGGRGSASAHDTEHGPGIGLSRRWRRSRGDCSRRTEDH
jgi:hypothetical protein